MSSTLTSHNPQSRKPLTPVERSQRRRLILQDGLALLSLTAITICIAVLTYFFFNSFREHRRVLEKRWYARGQKALSSGRPQDAVQDFRSALSLSTANVRYEMSLAEALASAGRTDEAYAYFSTLHEAEPGDGFLNLQLARLEVRRKNPSAAIDFYRSALNGAWGGHGTARRLGIRLELARYLLSLGKLNDAQGELLTAEGNSLDNPAALYSIAELLRKAEDPSDAWTAYQRVVRHPGTDRGLALEALLGEAEVASSMGQYKRAALALDRYTARQRMHPVATAPEQKKQVAAQLARLQRMLQLIPFYGLQPKQRARRILMEASIAHKRFLDCTAHLQAATPQAQPAPSAGGSPVQANPAPAKGQVAQPSPPAPDATGMSALALRWQQLSPFDAPALGGNADLEQNLVDLINQTEILTAKVCGAPTGDDTLLLQLAQVPDKTE
ncbi:MAG TPA: tetratricopeptide repeat protein [Acidobacteriaceae bacterium]|nr:tetratricopeptide repeat protein [Acidobacteriaceae bacterium]